MVVHRQKQSDFIIKLKRLSLNSEYRIKGLISKRDSYCASYG